MVLAEPTNKEKLGRRLLIPAVVAAGAVAVSVAAPASPVSLSSPPWTGQHLRSKGRRSRTDTPRMTLAREYAPA